MKLKKLTERLPFIKKKDSKRPLLFDKKEVEKQLRLSMATLEPVFGNLGHNIYEIDEKAQNLQGDCQKLLELSGGKGNGAEILLRAANALEEPMRQVHEAIQKREEIGDLMKNCERVTGHLMGKQNSMYSVVEPLKFMLVFYKIEAAHLPADEQATFTAVAHEIMRLHKMIDETFRENISQLRVAKASIVDTLESFVKEQAKHSKEVGEARISIKHTRETLSRQLRDNSEKDTDLNQATSAFQFAINNLVTALQAEDIFRQRCESIIDLLDEQPADVSDKAWSLLQYRKISAAAREMRESSSDVQRSLKVIVSQANELDDISVYMDQFESMTASADGMIQVLLDSFDSLTEIYAHSYKLSSESGEAVRPIKELVKGLSVIVSEVSIDIQFIALNAQVRSVQVGEGSGLEVLAARTADISAELRLLGDGTAENIEDMQRVVSELSNMIDMDLESNSLQSKELEDNSGDIKNALHGMRNETFEILGAVSDTMKFVKKFVVQDLMKLSEFDTVADQLDRVANQILVDSGIQDLDPTELVKLESELTLLLEVSEKTTHTSIERTKENDAILWDEDENEVDDRLASPVKNGEVELF